MTGENLNTILERAVSLYGQREAVVGQAVRWS
jgi:hypothetical protein